MANGNKAAKVSILGSYVYKNSQVDKIKIDNLNDSHAIMKGSIYIPNIKNLLSPSIKNDIIKLGIK